MLHTKDAFLHEINTRNVIPTDMGWHIETQVEMKYNIMLKNCKAGRKCPLIDCPLPCEAWDFYNSAFNKVRIADNSSELRLYFPSKVAKNTETQLYPMSALLAELGGFVGLLLGFSLLDFFTNIIFRVSDKLKSMEASKQYENEIKR